MLTQKDTTHSIKSLLERLWRHISYRRKIQLGLLLLLMMVASIAELVSIGAVLPFLGLLTAPDVVFSHAAVKPFINTLDLTSPEQLLAPLAILFGFAALFAGAIRFLLAWAQARLSYSIGADLSASIFRRTLYLPYLVHVSRNSSEVISGITQKADGIVNNALFPVLVIISSGLILSTVLIGFLIVDPTYVASIISCLGVIYFFVIRVTRPRMLKYSHVINHQQNKLIKILQEALGGIRDVILNSIQEVYCKIFEDSDWSIRRAQSNIVIISTGPRYLIEALGMAFLAILVYFLSKRQASLELIVPILGTVALAAQRMLPLVQQSYSNWSIIRGSQYSLNHALELLEHSVPDQVGSQISEPLSFKKEITLDGVDFRYSERDPLVLDGLNLRISKRARIGIIGTTGSGKSTLLDILMGLISPTNGVMKVDGRTIGPQELKAWQNLIAHVPQSIFLMDASIAENIAFGVPADQIDFARVIRAAQGAQIASTIDGWEDKYNTVIGERGVRLSGGQRQRIGIARALYKKAEVLIFDEATSALDAHTENSVMDALENLDSNLTILIVAHRLTTLKGCTQITELKNGKVCRVGTYDEIISSTK